MPDPLKFFISYNHADRAWAEWIAWQLEAAGHEAVVQSWDFGPGKNFVLEMQRAAQEADRTIAVLSSSYLEAEFTQSEWAAAFGQDPVGKNGKLLPVRVADCSPKGILGPIVYLDLAGVRDPKMAREALLTGVLAERAKPDEEPIFPGVSSPQYPGATRTTEEEPHYEGPESRLLASALKAAHDRKLELEANDSDTTETLAEILRLKRRLREGGQLQAGDLLSDRFRLIEAVGRGGFATVWKAKDIKKQELSAVKVLHGQYRNDRARMERFFRGARKMARLQHPGIVRVIEEEGEDGGHYYFVMEYVRGGDLRRAALARRLSIGKRLDIVREVGSALAFAHRNGLIHRDLKPANILLTEKGEPKLTDFDLVLASDSTGGTRTAAIMGSFFYSAPEALQNPRGASASSDQYSLGMTALFLLHGTDLPLDVLRNPEPILSELKCSHTIKSCLARAIAWEAKNRYSSVTEFCNNLRGAAQVLDFPDQKPYQPNPFLVDEQVSLDKAEKFPSRSSTITPGKSKMQGPKKWLLAAALLLFVLTLVLANRTGFLQGKLESLPGPSQSIDILDIVPADVARAEENAEAVVLAPRTQRFVVILTISSTAEFPSHHLEITGHDNELIFALEHLMPSSSGNFSLELSRKSIPEGRYHLLVYGVESDGRRLLVEDILVSLDYGSQ